ncbi:MAG TPA: M28 family peptidase [Ignavibacteriales bacterium]|nr:M28 family peptidase [Ignavibacteriales bacterium]
MKIWKFLPVIFLLTAPFCRLSAQPILAAQDPSISEMIKEISAGNIKSTVEKLVSFRTRHTLSPSVKQNEGLRAAQEWVKSEFEKYAKDSGGRFETGFDTFFVEPDGRRIPRRTELRNVMATLKGTDSRDTRVLIVSAHLDSRAGAALDSTSFAPGANDDASGVALTLELARIMSKRKFPCTIIFTAVSGEEQGLYGSTFLAKKAKNLNWNVTAMFNNDMVGNSFSDGTTLRDNTRVRVFSEGDPAFETEEMAKFRKYSGGENDSRSRQLARYIKETGEKYVDQIEVKLIYRKDRYLRGGDHTPFNNEGFTAVRFTEMNENYNHQHQDPRIENGVQYGDLPEFVDYDYAAKITGLNLAALASLALAPASPEKVVIDLKELSNFSKLEWTEPNDVRKPAGYNILIRETDQPLWQKKIFVTGTKAVIPYSKDNYFFAVESVDSSGHESLPVVPMPNN